MLSSFFSDLVSVEQHLIVVEALIEDVMGVFLDGEGGVFQESKVFHLHGVV